MPRIIGNEPKNNASKIYLRTKGRRDLVTEKENHQLMKQTYIGQGQYKELYLDLKMEFKSTQESCSIHRS